jgi:predicted nucleic acid-binding protein
MMRPNCAEDRHLHRYYERAFELLPWHTAIPYSYGMLSGLTRRCGVTVGDNDCWIAAWCEAYRLPLVTMNRRHFEPLLDYGLELEL